MKHQAYGEESGNRYNLEGTVVMASADMTMMTNNLNATADMNMKKAGTSTNGSKNFADRLDTDADDDLDLETINNVH